MEEQRQTELKRKLDAEMAAKKAAASQVSFSEYVICCFRKYPYPHGVFALNPYPPPLPTLPSSLDHHEI